MKITRNNLMVRVEKESTVTGSSGEKVINGAVPLLAKVLAVGPEVKEVTVGDLVAFSPYGFDEISVNGEKLVVIGEGLILAIYEAQDRYTKAKG